MDSIDAQLLRILAEDARCSATDISKKVNLSIPAVNKRISRLRENGIIERFTIQLNPQKINSSVQAFVMLVVDQYSRVNELLEFVNAKENIVDCYAITGEYDYSVKTVRKGYYRTGKHLTRTQRKKVCFQEPYDLCADGTQTHAGTRHHLACQIPSTIRTVAGPVFLPHLYHLYAN